MTEVSAPLPAVQVHFGDGHYGVFDHGAHVFSWRPSGSAHDVLWLSSASAFAAGKAIRGGVPICFPWFGPGATGDRTPAHGFVRTVDWRREAVHDSGAELQVDYVIDRSMTGEQPFFPYDYRARLTVQFGPERLRLTLRAENAGTDPFTIEEALHTYLAVSDVRQVTLDGLDGAAYLDKVAGDTSFDRVQVGTLQVTGATDRVYQTTAEVTVHDPGYGRTLRVSTSGASNVVVWNPWSDGADAMADVGAGEWRQMVCVEAANAFADSITLLPGEHWSITQQIELMALERSKPAG